MAYYKLKELNYCGPSIGYHSIFSCRDFPAHAFCQITCHPIMQDVCKALKRDNILLSRSHRLQDNIVSFNLKVELIPRSYQALNMIILNLFDFNMLALSRVDNFHRF